MYKNLVSKLMEIWTSPVLYDPVLWSWKWWIDLCLLFTNFSRVLEIVIRSGQHLARTSLLQLLDVSPVIQYLESISWAPDSSCAFLSLVFCFFSLPRMYGCGRMKHPLYKSFYWSEVSLLFLLSSGHCSLRTTVVMYLVFWFFLQ